MLGLTWLIFPSLAALVEGGLTSASAEALGKAGGKTVRGAAGNNVNTAAQNGVPLNGQAVVAHLVPLGGTLFLQQAVNQAGQPPIQQLIPLGAIQQGQQGGQFVVGQAGGVGVSVGARGQPGQQGQPGQTSPFTLFALLPQGGAVGNPQNAFLAPGQVQFVSAAGLNNQQQQQQQQQLQQLQQLAAGNAGKISGGLRFVRSAATLLRRTDASGSKVMASEEDEEEEEEEEGSGMDRQGKQ